MLRRGLDWDEIGRYVAAHPEQMLSPEKYADYVWLREMDEAVRWHMRMMSRSLLEIPIEAVVPERFAGLESLVEKK